MDMHKLLFECWDYDQTGNHDLIGQFSTTFRELNWKQSYSFINPTKKAK